MNRSFGGRLCPLPLAAALLVALCAAPGRAVGPDGGTAREPYAYPTGPEHAEGYPDGWVRVPAAAADLLLVRPVMVVGLAAGVVLFVATLPVTAATLTTDDAAHALFGQTKDALVRPLGEF